MYTPRQSFLFQYVLRKFWIWAGWFFILGEATNRGKYTYIYTYIYICIHTHIYTDIGAELEGEYHFPLFTGLFGPYLGMGSYTPP